MKKSNLFLLVLTLMLSTSSFALSEDIQEVIPDTGYVVNDDGADIKAGDNINFETLCKLKKSAQVKIVDKRYSWYKIALPKEAYLYITKDYVDLTNDEKGTGIIKASRVNLRAGAGTKYSILGQLSRGDKIFIVSEDSGWYKIEPPYGITGWVNISQVITQPKQFQESVIAKEKEIEQELKTRQAPKKKSADLRNKTSVQKKQNDIIRLDIRQAPPKGNLSISDKE